MTHNNSVEKYLKLIAWQTVYCTQQNPAAARMQIEYLQIIIYFCANDFSRRFLQINLLLVVQMVLVHRAEVECCESPRQGGVVLQASLGGAGENLNKFIIRLCFL